MTEVAERRDVVALEVGDWLRTLLHEIRQPVAVVLALAEAARGVIGLPPELLEYLDRIEDQVQEIPSAASSVFEEARGAGTESGPVHVEEVVDSVVRAFAFTWTGTVHRWGGPCTAWVHGSRSAIRRCVVNLVDNAARAAGPSGTVWVRVSCARGSVRVVVEDDGPGFGLGPSGTGIGLPVTRRTVQALGGSVTAGPSAELGGALVAISLPVPDDDRRPRYLASWPPTG
ncbi:sensor histidine kinase [Blastococcus sp. SYSU D00669]